MQITDFLQRHFSSQSPITVAYQTDICEHFDGFLRQLCPPGVILAIVSPIYREYAERSLMPSLSAHGYETRYCLCMPEPGTTIENQIGEALSDGALNGLSGIVSLGGNEMFAAARMRGRMFQVPVVALLSSLPGRDLLDTCSDDPGVHPYADGIFFDLDRIADALRGDLREPLSQLELENALLRADYYTAQCLGSKIDSGVLEAVRCARSPHLPRPTQPTEDDLASLVEAYVWQSAAYRLLHETRLSSYETLESYALSGADFPHFDAMPHVHILNDILDAVLSTESLEISPEACANRQPPKEIRVRTLQQILLEDGIKFEWLKRAEANYEDRLTMRLGIHAISLTWDTYCAYLRPVSDMLHLVSSEENTPESVDPLLKQIWLHSANFAPKHSFLKLMNDMRLLETTLYT